MLGPLTKWVSTFHQLVYPFLSSFYDFSPLLSTVAHRRRPIRNQWADSLIWRNLLPLSLQLLHLVPSLRTQSFLLFSQYPSIKDNFMKTRRIRTKFKERNCNDIKNKKVLIEVPSKLHWIEPNQIWSPKIDESHFFQVLVDLNLLLA